MNLFELITI